MEGVGGASVMEEQLSMHCRRWLLQVDNLVLAHERSQQLATATSKVQPRPSTTAAGSKLQPPATARPGAATNAILELYQQGLQSAVQAFLDFSELTQWHVQPDPAANTTLKLSTEVRTVSRHTWWQIIDSGLLRRTGDAMLLVRVPHLTTGCGRGEEGEPVRHTLRVGSFHETILRACGVMIAGIGLAPLELWRPMLEQLLEPRGNGFLLLLADALGALIQTAPTNPLLFQERHLTPSSPAGHKRMSVRLDLVGHEKGKTTQSSVGGRRSGLDKVTTATEVIWPPSPDLSDLTVSSQASSWGQIPLPRTSFGGFGPVSSVPATDLVNAQWSPFGTNPGPGQDAPQSPIRVSTSGAPITSAPSFASHAQLTSGGGTETPLVRMPSGGVPMLSLAGISPGGIAQSRLKARLQAEAVAAAPASDAGTDEPGEDAYISRRAALCCMQILRDINELASQELSLRRGSTGSVAGLPSIRVFLDSLVDLRAGLAGALQHLGMLGHLASIYRTSEELSMSREELFPVMEGIVAVACCASSPDLPAPGAHGRQGQRQGDVRLFTNALQPQVISLLTEELHQAMAGVSAQVRARHGETFLELPRGLQAQVSLVRHLCECLIIFGAAPLPAHNTPHASDLLGQPSAPAPAASPFNSPAPSPHKAVAVARVTTLSRHSIVKSASRSSLKINASRNSTGDDNGSDCGGLGGEVSPLLTVVRDLVAAVRLFLSFAVCDAPFFCTAADSWLPTVKMLVRRLASEGHTDLVEEVMLVLCECAAAMTAAMSMSAAKAAEADRAAQAKISGRLSKQMAGGLLLDHSVETEVYVRLMRRRGHPDRPYGWGAGASAGDAGTRLVVTPRETQPRGHADSLTLYDDTSLSPRIARLQTQTAGSDLYQRQGSMGHASSGGNSARTPRTGMAALLPRSDRSGENTARSQNSNSQIGSPRADMEWMAAGGHGMTTSRGAPPPRKNEKKSELSALWAALGYNADGVTLDAVAKGDDWDETDSVGLAAWPGLSKQFVVHFEEILRSVLHAILHLLRGYLLPIKWRSLPWDVAVQLTAHHAAPPRTPVPGAAPASPFSAFFSPTKSPPTPPAWGRSDSHAFSQQADTPRSGGDMSSLPGSPARGGGRKTLAASGPVPPVISLALGSRLFKSGAATALAEGDVMGDVPQSVTSLMESVSRAGLLQAVEALFQVELMTDQMYNSHTAAVDTNMLASVRAKGGSASQLDRCRVTAVRLVRDMFGNAPQMVSDRGVHMLRSLRKFMTSKLLTPPVVSASATHPLSRFTSYTPPLDLPSSLDSPTHVPTPSITSINHVDTALAHLPSTQDVMQTRLTMLMSGASSEVQSGQLSGGLPCRTSRAHEVEGGAAPLTAYCMSSLVALALELLPLPRIAAARATADLAPGPTRGSGWVPSPLKVLGASLLLVHTWPALLLLLNALMRTLRLGDGTSSSKPSTKLLTTTSSTHTTAGAGGKDHQTKSVRMGRTGGRTTSPKRPSTTPTISSIREMLHSSPPGQESAQQQSQSQSPKKGPGHEHLAHRTRSLAPLHRLLEAWLQQLNQLLHRYSNMESLRSCLEMSLLHGGMSSLLLSLIGGQHFTLVSRARLLHPADTPGAPAAYSRQGSLLSATNAEAALRSRQGGGWAADQGTLPTMPPVNREQAMIQRKYQREIDREYGLSGMALVSLEELLCLTHQLCTPALSTQLVVSGTVRALQEATITIHTRHLTVVSMLRVIAATHLLTVGQEDAEGEDVDDAAAAAVATTPSRTHSISSSPRKGGLTRLTSMSRDSSPTRAAGGRDSSHTRAGGGRASRPTSPTHGGNNRPSRPNSAGGNSPTGRLAAQLRSPAGAGAAAAAGAFSVADVARIRSQSIFLADDVARTRAVNFHRDTEGGYEDDGDEEDEEKEVVGEGEDGDGGGDSGGGGGGLGGAEGGAVVSFTRENSRSTAGGGGRSRRSTFNSGLARVSSKGASAWSDAALSMIHADAAADALPSGLDLSMPRAGHWLLMASSVVKKATCGVAIAAAQLAAVKLSTGSVGALAERYTTGANPAAATASSLPPQRSALTSGAGDQEASAIKIKRMSSGGSSVGGRLSSSSGAAGDGSDRGTRRSRRKSGSQSGANPATTTANKPHAMDSSQVVSVLNAAAMAAARTLEQLNGQQPQTLLQHCRQLLIACKSSGVGQEIIGMLSALPVFLDPASQLRSMQVELRTMSTPAIQAAHEAGVEIAANAIAVLDRVAEGGRWAASPGLTKPKTSGGVSGTPTTSSPSIRSPMLMRHLPASAGGSESPTRHQSRTPQASEGGAAPAPAGGVRSSLTVVIPARAGSPEGVQPTPTATPPVKPPGHMTGAAGAEQGPLGVGSQGWEAHASVMVVDDPPDQLWMEAERLKLQKAQLEATMRQLDGAVPLLLDLPRPELNSATPALNERPHLLGCCNVYCINTVPGRPEKEVALRRCERCQRVWYCSDACRAAAAPSHKLFCHFSAALVG